VTTTITGAVALDVRFPTSRDLSGSDAMNEAPDYSAAYVIQTPTSRATGSPSPSAGATSSAWPP
jgi:L-fuconate dehydratase